MAASTTPATAPDQFGDCLAWVNSHKNSFQTTTDQQLALYAFFKQATIGPCNVPKPSFFDFVGKSKWEAWKKVGSLSSEEAKAKYVKLITGIVPDWREQLPESSAQATPSPKKKHIEGNWVCVSTPVVEKAEEVKEEEKDICYWASEGSIEEVKKALQKGEDVNKVDENGQSSLHWACDHGDLNLVKYLLEEGARVNLQDQEGMTALHYASLCGNESVVRFLVEECEDLDLSLRDHDNFNALDVTESDCIRSFLQPRYNL